MYEVEELKQRVEKDTTKMSRSLQRRQERRRKKEMKLFKKFEKARDGLVMPDQPVKRSMLSRFFHAIISL